jgi:C-terminal processing protease CtpA/Prc
MIRIFIARLFILSCFFLLFLSISSRSETINTDSLFNKRSSHNLEAFAKAYGYARYFYPTKINESVKWDQILITGCRRVLYCLNDGELVDSLESIFEFLGTDFNFNYIGRSVKVDFSEKRYNKGCLRKMFWQHFGFSDPFSNSLYKSILVNSSDLPLATNFFFIDLTSYSLVKGDKIKLNLRITDIHPKSPKLTIAFSDKLGNEVAKKELIRDNGNEFNAVVELNKTIFSLTLSFGLYDVSRFKISDINLQLFRNNNWINLNVPSINKFSLTNETWQYLNLGAFNIIATENNVEVLNNSQNSLDNVLFRDQPKLTDTIRSNLSDSIKLSFPLVRDVCNVETIDKCKGLVESESDNSILYVSGVIQLWNALQHFHPNWDYFTEDWASVLKHSIEQALLARSQEDQYNVLNYMVSCINDGHGFVYNQLIGDKHGLPFKVEFIESKYIVTGVDSSAQDSIGIGDEILELDGIKIDALVENEMKSFSGSRQWKFYQAVESFGFGNRNTLAKVAFKHKNSIKNKQFVRDYKYSIPDNRVPFYEIQKGYYYIDLSKVQEEDLQKRMLDLSSAKGVIFDLRNRPIVSYLFLCNLINIADTAKSWMAVPLITYPDHSNKPNFYTSGWRLKPSSPQLKLSVAFISSPSSISYTESLLSLVEHYKLGAIISEGNSAGANGDICFINLPKNFIVYWTGMRVNKLNGDSFINIGIKPTIQIKRTISGIVEGKDELLLKAIEHILGH